MQLSNNALLLIVLSLNSAIASPTLHRHFHEKRVDYTDKTLYKDVDWTKVNYNGAGGTTPAVAASPSVPENKAAAAAPESKSAPAPSQEAPSQAATGGSSTSGFGGQTAPKDDGIDAERVGNVGSPYGSNMKKIAESEIANYKYTNLVCNTGSSPVTVIVWNKACPDGNVAGWSCPHMKLQLPAGGKQALAFDEDSQGGLSLDCGTDPARGGVPNCTWGEFDFGNKHNQGYSGYDRSSIPNSNGNTGKLTMSAHNGPESSQKENSFTDVSQTHAGGVLVAGPAHMRTEF